MSAFSGAIGLLEQRDDYGDYRDAIRVLEAAEDADKISMTTWLTKIERELKEQHSDFSRYLDALPGPYTTASTIIHGSFVDEVKP